MLDFVLISTWQNYFWKYSMFDYNPMSSMLMYKALSVGIEPEKPAPPELPKRRFNGLIKISKQTLRIRMETLMPVFRSSFSSIAIKCRQLKLFATRSSLPE
jgi:hypothetical protein